MEPPNGYKWSGRRLTNVQARVFMVRGEVKNVVQLSTKGRKQWAFEKPKLHNARKLRGMFLHRSGRHRVQGHHEKRAHKVGDATGTGHGMYDWHCVCGNLLLEIRHSQIKTRLYRQSTRASEIEQWQNSCQRPLRSYS